MCQKINTIDSFTVETMKNIIFKWQNMAENLRRKKKRNSREIFRRQRRIPEEKTKQEMKSDEMFLKGKLNVKLFFWFFLDRCLVSEPFFLPIK